MTRKKRHRVDDPRQTLRDFAEFIKGQDPVALAAEAQWIDQTIQSCKRIQTFFRRYVAALKARPAALPNSQDEARL